MSWSIELLKYLAAKAQLIKCTFLSVCPSVHFKTEYSKLMTAHDSLWQLKTAHDSLWELLTAYVNLWQLKLLIAISLWQLLTAYNIFWQLLTAFDSLQNLLTAYKIYWQLLTAFDNLWQLMTAYDNFWQLRTAYDSLWQLRCLSSSQELCSAQLAMILGIRQFGQLIGLHGHDHESLFGTLQGLLGPFKAPQNNPKPQKKITILGTFKHPTQIYFICSQLKITL